MATFGFASHRPLRLWNPLLTEGTSNCRLRRRIAKQERDYIELRLLAQPDNHSLVIFLAAIRPFPVDCTLIEAAMPMRAAA